MNSLEKQKLCLLEDMLKATAGEPAKLPANKRAKILGELLPKREEVLRVSEEYFSQALTARGVDENPASWHALAEDDYTYVNALRSAHLKAKARHDIARAAYSKLPTEDTATFVATIAKGRRWSRFSPRRLAAGFTAFSALAFADPERIKATYDSLATSAYEILMPTMPVVTLDDIYAQVNIPQQTASLEKFIIEGDCTFYPVADQELLITGFPGKRDYSRNDHGNSVDVRARAGKKIKAACDGVVTERGVNKQGYNYVVLDTERGFEIEMLHVRSTLPIGTRVEAGDYIAAVRTGEKDHQSGTPLAPHLHTTVRITDTNNTIRYPRELAGYEVPLPCILENSIRDELALTSATFAADSAGFAVPSGLKYDKQGKRVRTVKEVRLAAHTLIPQTIREQCDVFAQAVLDTYLRPGGIGQPRLAYAD